MTNNQTEPHLLEEQRGHILLLTLNRPDARNAISPEMACRLADTFDKFRTDNDLRVLVLTGRGDKAFCSGGDLALTLPLLTGDRQPETDWDHRIVNDSGIMDRSALRKVEIDKPIICAINGPCFAGGMETMLATDVRVACETAVFGLPEAKRGLIPFAGSLVRLPRQLPQAVAMELLLTGEPIDAARALAVGLVNHVVPADQVLPTALNIAQTIAANGPLAVQQIKRTVGRASGSTLAEGFAFEDEAKAIVLNSQDAREGPRAFVEKRTARFVGK